MVNLQIIEIMLACVAAILVAVAYITSRETWILVAMISMFLGFLVFGLGAVYFQNLASRLIGASMMGIAMILMAVAVGVLARHKDSLGQVVHKPAIWFTAIGIACLFVALVLSGIGIYSDFFASPVAVPQIEMQTVQAQPTFAPNTFAQEF